MEYSGHGIKFIRAVMNGERESRSWGFQGGEEKEGFVVQSDMWWKMAAMCKSPYQVNFPKNGVPYFFFSG